MIQLGVHARPRRARAPGPVPPARSVCAV